MVDDKRVCVCGHDSSVHTEMFFAECTVEDCNCDDFELDDREEEDK